MGVINAFEVTHIRMSPADKMVFMKIDRTNPPWAGTFKYDISIKYSPGTGLRGATTFFFCLTSMKCMIVTSSTDTKSCAILSFWVENEVPVLSASYVVGQESILHAITKEFKNQYASYLLDNIINS